MDLSKVLNQSSAGDGPTPQKSAAASTLSSHQPPRAYAPPLWQARPRPPKHPSSSPAQHHLDFHNLSQKPAPAEFPSPQDSVNATQRIVPPYTARSHFLGSDQYRPRSAPPLQTTNFNHDARSPGALPAPSPSPYQSSMTLTPTNASSPSSPRGYPFPQMPPARERASPRQHQPQPGVSHVPLNQPPHHVAQQTQYLQQQQQLKHERDEHQTRLPPKADNLTPGVHHQQPQIASDSAMAVDSPQSHFYQQSMSTHSTPILTPTNPLPQFVSPRAQVSPSATVQNSLPRPDRKRTRSSASNSPVSKLNNRQPAQTTDFAPPLSPSQQRIAPMPRTGVPSIQTQNFAAKTESSAAPQRNSSVITVYKSETSELAPHPRPSHERESSLSMSPRLRCASNTSIPDGQQGNFAASRRSLSSCSTQAATDKDSHLKSSSKRKLQQRSLNPAELEHRRSRSPPGATSAAPAKCSKQSAFTTDPAGKRVPYSQPPIWSQSVRSLNSEMPKHANFVLQKARPRDLNGKRNDGSLIERGRPPTADASRPLRSDMEPAASQANVSAGPQDILGPWEASILGVKPYEEFAKNVADFFFIHVVDNGDSKEIANRCINFEIEAKLGTLIDKDTNCRVDRLVDSECTLRETSRVAFQSSMTEALHKYFNDFLNQTVLQTDPRAPDGTQRIQVQYAHRREIDRFFELPADMQNRLPGCMRARFGSRQKRIRVRVTYDQKSGEVRNAIVKARVADLDLHMPTCPMDCRLSINLEMAWDGSVEELERLASMHTEKQPDRNKDRLSYTHGHYQIDLTQVTQMLPGPGNTMRMEKEHELEIELAPGIVIDQGSKAMNGAPHRYQELIEGFLDNVRVLTRKARDFAQQNLDHGRN